jgi:hypothetical protein
MSRSHRTRCSVAVLVLLGALLSACQSDAQPTPPPDDRLVVTREPLETAIFLDAYLRGDPDVAEEVAAPLLEAEWARRGRPLPERPEVPGEGALPLRFAFVGGVLEDSGVGHYLYLATPSARWHLQQRLPSVWRLDTDPSGRVVWAGVVWLFSADTPVTATVRPPPAVAGDPTGSEPSGPTVLIRLQSATTQERYEVLRAAASDRSSGTASPAALVSFYASDEEGAVRAGVWSYDQPVGLGRLR